MFVGGRERVYWEKRDQGNIWDKVFKNGPGKICGRIPGPFLNTLSHLSLKQAKS